MAFIRFFSEFGLLSYFYKTEEGSSGTLHIFSNQIEAMTNFNPEATLEERNELVDGAKYLPADSSVDSLKIVSELAKFLANLLVEYAELGVSMEPDQFSRESRIVGLYGPNINSPEGENAVMFFDGEEYGVTIVRSKIAMIELFNSFLWLDDRSKDFFIGSVHQFRLPESDPSPNQMITGDIAQLLCLAHEAT